MTRAARWLNGSYVRAPAPPPVTGRIWSGRTGGPLTSGTGPRPTLPVGLRLSSVDCSLSPGSLDRRRYRTTGLGRQISVPISHARYVPAVLAVTVVSVAVGFGFCWRAAAGWCTAAGVVPVHPCGVIPSGRCGPDARSCMMSVMGARV